MKKALVLGSVLSGVVPMFAQTTVDVTAATTAIADAATGAGTIIAAGLAFAALWIAYKYGKRIFGKA